MTRMRAATRAFLAGWRLFAADNPGVDFDVLGTIDCGGESYPIPRIRLAGGERRALLVAGIHGDEPAGPEALKRFVLESAYQPFASGWSFDVLPLVSPCGFAAGTRSTPFCEDPNREFPGSGGCRETAILWDYVRDRRWDLLLSLHEDCDADGIYLYDSGRRDRDGFLRAMTASARWLSGCERRGLAVSAEPAIDGSINHGGIIVGSDTDFPAFEPTMYRSGRARRSVVVETPSTWDLHTRVSIHLSALDHYLGDAP